MARQPTAAGRGQARTRALTGQGSSQASPSQPAVQEQEPSVGLQAAPLAQAQLSLQFMPHVPLGHGRVQSRPCHPEGRERVRQLSVGAPHGFLPTPPSRYLAPEMAVSLPTRSEHTFHVESALKLSRVIRRPRVSPRDLTARPAGAQSHLEQGTPEMGRSSSAQGGIRRLLLGPFVLRVVISLFGLRSISPRPRL